MADPSSLSSILESPVWISKREDLVGYRICGKDAHGFLHRMSTNHVEHDPPGQACLNSFVDRRGRMISLVQQVTVRENELFLCSAEGTPLHEWLDQYLFAEDVEIEHCSDEGAFLSVGGPSATESLAHLFSMNVEKLLPWGALCVENRVCMRAFDGLGANRTPHPEYILYTHSIDADVGDFLSQKATEFSAETYEIDRIRKGVPRSGAEISSASNPLELGLHDSIHWSKGCYIGQEVISRIDNYDKQSRRLVGLELEPAYVGQLQPGEKLYSGEHVIGTVTSVSPRFHEGLVSVLAMVRISALADTGSLMVQLGGEEVKIAWRQRFAEQHLASDSD